MNDAATLKAKVDLAMSHARDFVIAETRRVEITPKTLARVRHSKALAVIGDFFGSTVQLQAAPPKTSHAIVDALDASVRGADGGYSRSAPPSPEGVGVVDIRGPLSQRAEYDLCGYVDGYDSVGERICAALRDDRAGAVIIRIDSPGGDVAGLEQMIAQVSRVRDAQGKTVLVFVDELAASAAMWIAAALATPAADGGGVFLTEAGRAGSVGVIAGSIDESEAWKQEGIKFTLYREPAGKAESHPVDPVQPLTDERITKLVKQSAVRFFAAMAVARGKTPDHFGSEGLNAEVFTGADAKSAGLVDGVHNYDLVLARAATAARRYRSAQKAKTMEANAEARLVKFDALAAKHGVSSPEALDAKIDTTAATLATVKVEAARVPELETKVAGYVKADEERAEAEKKAAAKAADDAAAAELFKGRRLAPHAKKTADALYAKHGVDALKMHLEGVHDMPTTPVGSEDRGEPEAKGAGEPTPSKKYSEATNRERADYGTTHGKAAYDTWKAAG